jgi:ribosomal protein S12 methylthiotransferase accessory factor YcaO
VVVDEAVDVLDLAVAAAAAVLEADDGRAAAQRHLVAGELGQEPEAATIDAVDVRRSAERWFSAGPPTALSRDLLRAYVHDADGNNLEAVCHKPE